MTTTVQAKAVMLYVAERLEDAARCPDISLDAVDRHEARLLAELLRSAAAGVAVTLPAGWVRSMSSLAYLDATCCAQLASR